MKTFKPVPTEIVSAITCDCCKTCFAADDASWFEIQSIEFVAGYSSIFGDGNSVSIDLCQDCLKQNLGPWLRVDSDPRQSIDDTVLEALHRSVGRASASIDEAARYVEESNHRIESMEKSKLAFKEGFTYAWTLFWSPFVGAFEKMKAEMNRPRASNWKEFIVNDIRGYFAPLTGAIEGVTKALKGRLRP